MQKWNPIDPGMARELVASEKWISRVRVNPDSGCHEWQGVSDRDGYGRIKVDGKVRLVHRVAKVAASGGDIPTGLVIDHLCRNRACVRPEHLAVVTNRENLLAPGSQSPSADRAQRTHCPHGHPLTPGNLDDNAYLRRMGVRKCLACQQIGKAAQHQIMRQAARSLGMAWGEYCRTHGQSYRTAWQILGLPPDDRPAAQLVYDGVITLPPDVMARCLAHLDDLAVEA